MGLKDTLYQLESVAIMTKFILYAIIKTIEDLGSDKLEKGFKFHNARIFLSVFQGH